MTLLDIYIKSDTSSMPKRNAHTGLENQISRLYTNHFRTKTTVNGLFQLNDNYRKI